MSNYVCVLTSAKSESVSAPVFTCVNVQSESLRVLTKNSNWIALHVCVRNSNILHAQIPTAST